MKSSWPVVTPASAFFWGGSENFRGCIEVFKNARENLPFFFFFFLLNSSNLVHVWNYVGWQNRGHDNIFLENSPCPPPLCCAATGLDMTTHINELIYLKLTLLCKSFHQISHRGVWISKRIVQFWTNSKHYFPHFVDIARGWHCCLLYIWFGGALWVGAW